MHLKDFVNLIQNYYSSLIFGLLHQKKELVRNANLLLKNFFEKPQRPHPNCKCKIQRILLEKTAQKVLIKNTPIVTDLLRGDTSPLFLFFSATSVINVHIKNLNPVRCADVNIDSYNELGKKSKSSYLLPLSSVVFTFSYFREAPVDWKLVLVTNFDDAQLLCTVKNIE